MSASIPFSPPRPVRPRRRLHLIALGLLATLSLSACGGGTEDGEPASETPDASAPTPTESPTTARRDRAGASSDGTPIRVSFGDTVLTARLFDNATARDLLAQLPLTLTFSDLNDVEKTAPLPRQLSLDGAPEGADPVVGDIGYWAPDGDLVFYYGDLRFWNGIVRIGEFDGSMNLIERQSDDFSATIERMG